MHPQVYFVLLVLKLLSPPNAATSHGAINCIFRLCPIHVNVKFNQSCDIFFFFVNIMFSFNSSYMIMTRFVYYFEMDV